MTRKSRGVFPWCGRPSSARSRSGGSARSSPRRDCRACKAHSSAPSTPRSLSCSRASSPAYSPSRRRKAGGRGKGCFGGFSTGSVPVVRPQVRKPLADINPRALPIEFFPDTIPRNVVVRHVCTSPRRGCSDHRCHQKKKSVSSLLVIIKCIYITPGKSLLLRY